MSSRPSNFGIGVAVSEARRNCAPYGYYGPEWFNGGIFIGAGIWPFGKGEIRVPSNTRILFLPQWPYLPIGTLREVVSYAMTAGGVDDATLLETLEAAGLPDVAGRLDQDGHWALQLSPGEQQHIAFAR